MRGKNKWMEKVLHRFIHNDADGIDPQAGLILDASGNLYGTTPGGNATGDGVVFQLTPGTNGQWTEKLLYSGVNSFAALIMDTTGNLYGTTSSHNGKVFELIPGSDGEWTKTVLWRFDGKDGLQPYAGLISDAAGNLYGTTIDGGAHTSCYGGCGTVFEVTP